MIVEDLSQLKPGQKVRISYGARVVKIDTRPDSGWLFLDGFGDDRNYWLPTDTPTLQVELLEPEYVHGAMYQDAQGGFWSFDQFYFGSERTDDSAAWFSPGDTSPYNFDVPVRPLTRLVPESGD